MHKKLAKVIGHRGVPSRATENSLSGFKLAAELEYSWIEIDVQATKDDQAVIFHDLKLDKSDNLEIIDYSYADLANFNIAHNSNRFEAIPKFSQCIDLANQEGLNLVVEIKTKVGREAKDVAVTLAEIDKIKTDFIVASFSATALELVQLEYPDIPLAFNTVILHNIKPEIKVNNIHFSSRYAHPSEINNLLKQGFGLYSYTVNDLQEAKDLFNYGVHGIFSDEYDIFKYFTEYNS